MVFILLLLRTLYLLPHHCSLLLVAMDPSDYQLTNICAFKTENFATDYSAMLANT